MKKKKRLLNKLNGLVRKSGVPRFLHHFGPKKYTTHQHLKSTFLKEKLKCAWKELVDEFLPYFNVYERIPDRSTLIKFAGRMPAYLWNLLLRWSAQVDYCSVGAIDATGLSRSNASMHYIQRIDRDTRTERYVKLSIYADIQHKKVLSARVRAKPRHDALDVAYLLKQSPVVAETNLMDKGYDSEKIHALFREQGVYSIIPARKGCVRGRYRKEMRDNFDYSQYWQRNIVETIISCIKRKFGSVLKAKKITSQRSEVYSRPILYNISLAIARLFHRSL